MPELSFTTISGTKIETVEKVDKKEDNISIKDVIPKRVTITKAKPSKSQVMEKAVKRLDEYDTQQILSDGNIIKEWFYADRDSDTGEMIYGISITGVMELAKRQRNLQADIPVDASTPDTVVYHVKCTDSIINVTTVGTADEPLYKIKDGKKMEAQFIRRVAASKAKRNGFRELLNQSVIEAEFKKWYQNKFGKEIKEEEYKSIVVVGANQDISQFTNQNK